jgi:hypothetical protein
MINEEGTVMKMLIGILLCAFASITSAQGIVVKKLQGDVSVRHGVTEAWTHVSVGDVLKPDDTMKIGAKGQASLLAAGGKRLALPPEVIVDMSDVRDLTPEELMLKLTMEKVRSSSYQWKSDEMHIPNTPVVHGPDRTPSDPLRENTPEVGRLEWNGTKVLFDNGYFSTSALKAMDILRRFPQLRENFDHRLLVAEALEKASLRREAMNEYVSISNSSSLTDAQQALIKFRIEELQKQFSQ